MMQHKVNLSHIGIYIFGILLYSQIGVLISRLLFLILSLTPNDALINFSIYSLVAVCISFLFIYRNISYWHVLANRPEKQGSYLRFYLLILIITTLINQFYPVYRSLILPDIIIQALNSQEVQLYAQLGLVSGINVFSYVMFSIALYWLFSSNNSANTKNNTDLLDES